MSIALFIERVKELAAAECEFFFSQGIDGYVICVLASEEPYCSMDLLQAAALGVERVRGATYHDVPEPEEIKQLLDLDYDKYVRCHRAVRAMTLPMYQLNRPVVTGYNRRLRKDLLDIIGYEEADEAPT